LINETKIQKIFILFFVLNKKVLILFNTKNRMNKISTFIPHLSATSFIVNIRYSSYCFKIS